MRVEILATTDTSMTGKRVLEAFAAGCRLHGIEIAPGGAETLVIFGAGEDRRKAAWTRAVSEGRRAILWDWGYWHDPEEHRFRVSIDGMHPARRIEMPHGRAIPAMQNVGNAAGPIYLCGLTSKSLRAYPEAARWESDMLTALRAKFPRRPIFYRHKPGKPARRFGLPVAPAVPIGRAMQGAGLFAVRHSNVAVDCAIHGVPCIAQAGVGSWLWPSQIVREERSEAERLAFLRDVSWWQWSIAEIERGEAWSFLQTVLSA